MDCSRFHARSPDDIFDGCLQQLAEVVERFQLERMFDPWKRCMVCNGLPETVMVAEVPGDAVPDDVRARFDRVRRCTGCECVYWSGSHTERVRRRLQEVGIEVPAP